MRLKHLALGSLFTLVALVNRTSHASSITETLNLVSTSSQAVGDAYIYPYNFSINGSSTLTSLMCISLDKEVTVGETWSVTAQSIDDSAADTAYREDALIYATLGKTDPTNGKVITATEVQMAVWDILDNTGVTTNAAYDAAFDSESQALVAWATGIENGNDASLFATGFFSSYTIYVPVSSDSAAWTAGTPQTFIGDPLATSAVTPEPASLLLLATGLAGAGAMMLRRRSQGAAVAL